MTITVDSYKNENCYVSLEIENRYNNNIYVVQIYNCINNNVCGYPLREITYPISEKKKALATFKRYIKNYGGK